MYQRYEMERHIIDGIELHRDPECDEDVPFDDRADERALLRLGCCTWGAVARFPHDIADVVSTIGDAVEGRRLQWRKPLEKGDWQDREAALERVDGIMRDVCGYVGLPAVAKIPDVRAQRIVIMTLARLEDDGVTAPVPEDVVDGWLWPRLAAWAMRRGFTAWHLVRAMVDFDACGLAAIRCVLVTDASLDRVVPEALARMLSGIPVSDQGMIVEIERGDMRGRSFRPNPGINMVRG